VKIYTRTGDHGTTGIIGGSRLTKDNLRIEAIGSLDDANAALGFALTVVKNSAPELDEICDILENSQRQIFNIGAEIATPSDTTSNAELFDDGATVCLENSMDKFNDVLPALRHFILPGGSEAGCRLHLARCSIRLCERRITAFGQNFEVRDNIRAYLNRLSDWLFVAARYCNFFCDEQDSIWEGKK